MRNLFKFFLALLMLSPSIIFAQAVTVTGVEGIVEVRLTPGEDWKVAYTGMEIPEGSSIRTAEKSRASIKFPNKSAIWMKENTNLAIKERQTKSTRLDLQAGIIKAKVPHLKRKEKFEVQSGNAVASVRGTVYTMQAAESGGVPQLNVLFGGVHLYLSVMDKPEGRGENLVWEADLPQGTHYEGKVGLEGTITTLTPEEELEDLRRWDVGLTPQQSLEPYYDKLQRMNDIREYANDVRGEIIEQNEKRDDVRKADFDAGRTLRDSHGNIVRVQQWLERPSNSTIQVTNVVVRTDPYKNIQRYSSGFDGSVYNGGAVSNRVDSLIMKVEFNQNDMPQSINELPGYLDSKSDVRIDRAQIVFANQTDPANVFTVGFFGQRASNSDEISPENLYIGTLQTDGGGSGRNKLLNLFDKNFSYQNGQSIVGLTRFVPDKDNSVSRTWLTLEDPGSSSTLRNRIVADGENGDLYNRDSRRWRQAADSSSKLWVVAEKFMINNSGGLRNISHFTKSDSFNALFSESALQMILSIKEHDSTTNAPKSTDAQNFTGLNVDSTHGRNIDVVVIPDIALSFVKSQGTKIFEKIKVNPPF